MVRSHWYSGNMPNVEATDDSEPRNRSRPLKTTKVSLPETSDQAHKIAPVVKPMVIKALPTVRDHTSDELNVEGDEYIPRDIDDAGEKKVTATGHPLDGREYRCRTFFVLNRKDKLFMLGTECARVLGYRDSYLLFNKNRSLYKIIATQAEKDDLIHQEILPYSYRSRQIAFVTARSMFRQFGSRLITNGRRVRDDYWESKARKQGFTEEDAAGEKRPGAAKAREAAAAEAAYHDLKSSSSNYFGQTGHHGYPSDVRYASQLFGGLIPGQGTILPSPPRFNYNTTNALPPQDYGSWEKSQSRSSGESLHYNDQTQTAEVNKQLEQQRKDRKQYIYDIWKRPHDPPTLAARPDIMEVDYMQQASEEDRLSQAFWGNAAVARAQHGIGFPIPQFVGRDLDAQPYRAQQDMAKRPDQMKLPPKIVMPQDTSDLRGPGSVGPSLSGGGHSGSGGEQPHFASEPRSPSTAVTTVTAPSENGPLEDSFSDSDSELNSSDRLLNPAGYLGGIQQLKQQIFQNSASKYQKKTVPDLPSNISDQEVLLRELQSLIVSICQSLRSLQGAGFCGNFFSVLVLDRFRPTVVKLLPIQVAKVERLSVLFKDTLLRFEENASQNLHTTTKGDTSATLATSRLKFACQDLLVQSQIIPYASKSLSPAYLWTMAVHFLDLAVLSYVGTHTEDLDDTYSDGSDGSLHIPGHFSTLHSIEPECPVDSSNMSVERRKLQCLDQFLGHRSVWVFQNATTGPTSERLYLSTDVATLADIWGPLWKTKPDEHSRNIFRYDIGSGFIVPWNRKAESDPDPCPNGEGGMEVFCHWISSRDWDDDYVEQHQTEVLSKAFLESDRLLIGAGVRDRLAVNSQCDMSMERKLKIKQELKNAGNLRHRGTCHPHQEKGSQAFQVQASAAGFATLGTTIEYKRTEGFNIKDALLQRWRNGARNVKYLEMWGGVEVSLCTKNARRIQLLHVLRSRVLRRYLKTICFEWIDRECETSYFEALKDRRSFRKFWRVHPEWQKNIGNAINECFIALEETGVDERDDELSALWVEEFEDDDDCEENDSGCNFVAAEEHLMILRRSEHNWTGLLKDSPECLTMAVAEDICLDFNDSNDFGMRCQGLRFSKDGKVARRFSPGYPVLQTAILINEGLLEDSLQRQLCYRTFSLKRSIADCVEEHHHADRKGKGRRVEPHSTDPAADLMEFFRDTSRNWKGYWNTTNLSKGTRFSLGSHGHLKVFQKSTEGHPVLMEWQPVMNTLGRDLKVEIKEKALGKSGNRHHSEYIEGTFWRSPLPCLILSSTKRDLKNTASCP
jgi:hypothetical protein